ncbi:MAG: glycosyltransferase family 4 protein [Firmicutes bacterium]|jgi:glycogen(starch) synthase|nr:glycosyltransferase family 4 protein [Bacillota bacterium]
MRVLMISYEYPPEVVGGLGAAVSGLARALARRGDYVQVISASSIGDAAPCREDGVIVSRVARSAFPEGLDLYGGGGDAGFLRVAMEANFGLATRGVVEATRDGPYDIIHAHDWHSAFAAKSLKHALKIPLVFTVHSTEYGRNRGIHSDLQRYIHEIEWMGTYEAWRVICCSKYMSSELRRIFSLPEDKIDVIPNGVDPPHLPEQELINEIRSRYAGSGERLVFYVGRLVYEKGVHVLLSSIPKVLEEAKNTRFVIAGDGYYAGVLREKADNLGIGDHVSFVGRISDRERDAFYAIADAAVFPSLYEPFGIVALEGMARGVPVVVSDTGGLGEVVRHEETGLKVYSGDADSLAWGIKRALLDESLQEKLRRNGPVEVRERFSWDQVADLTFDVYRRVLSEAASVPW